MEVPRFWRNKNFMLNPNQHGYRPEHPLAEVDPESAVQSKGGPVEMSVNIEKRAVVYQSPTK